MRYNGNSNNLQQLASELNVNRVLQGSIRKYLNTIRVTVQLIDVDKQENIWGKNYDRELQGYSVCRLSGS